MHLAEFSIICSEVVNIVFCYVKAAMQLTEFSIISSVVGNIVFAVQSLQWKFQSWMIGLPHSIAPCPILAKLSARLGIKKCQFLRHWFDSIDIPDLPKQETDAQLIRPSSLVFIYQIGSLGSTLVSCQVPVKQIWWPAGKHSPVQLIHYSSCRLGSDWVNIPLVQQSKAD